MTTAIKDPGRLAIRVVATTMWLIYVLGLAGSTVLDGLARKQALSSLAIPLTAFATVGWVLAIRRPRNPLGWLFLSIGTLTGLGVSSQAYIDLAVHRGWPAHGLVIVCAWFQLWYWYPLVFIATGYTTLLFPSGLPSPRWRPVLALMTVSLASVAVGAALSPDVQVGRRNLPNPIGVAVKSKDIENTLGFHIATMVMAGCLIASVFSLAVRFRRSRGNERAQLKWFLLGALLLVLTFTVSAAWPAYNHSAFNDTVFALTLAFLPLSCALAILRYRLYDIDRIVSRTVSYLVVTGLVVGVYLCMVALIDTVLGFSGSFGVAASTLAAAAAFQPLRTRVQRVVDRRFDRAAYDLRRTVDEFSARLRDEVDVDTISSDLLRTAASAVAPARASLWLVAT